MIPFENATKTQYRILRDLLYRHGSEYAVRQYYGLDQELEPVTIARLARRIRKDMTRYRTTAQEQMCPVTDGLVRAVLYELDLYKAATVVVYHWFPDSVTRLLEGLTDTGSECTIIRSPRLPVDIGLLDTRWYEGRIDVAYRDQQVNTQTTRWLTVIHTEQLRDWEALTGETALVVWSDGKTSLLSPRN